MKHDKQTGILTILKKFFVERDHEQLERELQSLLDAGEENGLIDPQSGEMIQSILEFRDTIVREVMIPRTEMIVLKAETPMEEVIDLIMKHSHTRIPVYEDHLDKIIGILNVKDLLKFWSKEMTQEDFLSVLRKPYFVPETMRTSLLLHELKVKKFHMAIVIDEYGGTAGLVTLEDLIEEIVGEISDEDETVPREEMVKISENTYLWDARTEIETVEEFFDVEFPEGNYETLAGLIFHQFGKIPCVGDSFQMDNLEITVEQADEKTIKKVRIVLLDSAPGH
ncbi:MAG: hemolysin family protein [Syntrophales bacterium]|jgi:magnesium and cobalt transporter|nr:hemolysin family protein [Syntrophales bacterium]